VNINSNDYISIEKKESTKFLETRSKLYSEKYNYSLKIWNNNKWLLWWLNIKK